MPHSDMHNECMVADAETDETLLCSLDDDVGDQFYCDRLSTSGMSLMLLHQATHAVRSTSEQLGCYSDSKCWVWVLGDACHPWENGWYVYTPVKMWSL